MSKHDQTQKPEKLSATFLEKAGYKILQTAPAIQEAATSTAILYSQYALKLFS